MRTFVSGWWLRIVWCAYKLAPSQRTYKALVRASDRHAYEVVRQFHAMNKAIVDRPPKGEE